MTQEPKSGDTILEGYVYAQKIIHPNNSGNDTPWHYYYPNSSSLYTTAKKAISANTGSWFTYEPLPHDPDTVEVYRKKSGSTQRDYVSTIQRKALKVKMVVE
jgi:hypothetical protein